jgi:hypothetical protein
MNTTLTCSHLPRGFNVTTEAPKSWADGRTGRFVCSPRGCIYLQCASDLDTGVLCTNEIYIVPADIDHSTNDISDEQAYKCFTANGWTIGPTRCPECLAKKNSQ